MQLIQLTEMKELTEFCRVLSTAPFYQKLGAGGVLAIYLTSKEMSLPFMFCLNGGMHNIEGKVVLSAQLMHMMLLNAGYKIEFLEISDKACHLRFVKPKNQGSEEFKYTVEDAKKAGYFGITGPQGTLVKKPKDNWIYHTLDMLFARCMSSGARKFAPQVIGACYGVGELDNDDFIVPVSPEFQRRETQSLENIQPLQIEDQRVDSEILKSFIDRNNILEGQPIYEYVKKIATKKNVNVETALEMACKNEESFVQAFNKMQEKNSAKPVEEVA